MPQLLFCLSQPWLQPGLNLAEWWMVPVRSDSLIPEKSHLKHMLLLCQGFLSAEARSFLLLHPVTHWWTFSFLSPQIRFHWIEGRLPSGKGFHPGICSTASKFIAWVLPTGLLAGREKNFSTDGVISLDYHEEPECCYLTQARKTRSRTRGSMDSLVFVTSTFRNNNEKATATSQLVQGKATKGSVLSGLKARVTGRHPTPRQTSEVLCLKCPAKDI